jgi:hypothetical protein
MPVNQSMMRSMRKQYGSEKGERVYYAMENKMKGKMKKSNGSARMALKHKLSKMYSK